MSSSLLASFVDQGFSVCLITVITSRLTVLMPTEAALDYKAGLLGAIKAIYCVGINQLVLINVDHKTPEPGLDLNAEDSMITNCRLVSVQIVMPVASSENAIEVPG